MLEGNLGVGKSIQRSGIQFDAVLDGYGRFVSAELDDGAARSNLSPSYERKILLEPLHPQGVQVDPRQPGRERSAANGGYLRHRGPDRGGV